MYTAYQVSGNIAVHDVDAWRYASVLGDYADAMGIKSDVLTDTVAEISNFIKNKDHNDVDPHSLRKLKGIVRRKRHVVQPILWPG